MFYYRILVMFAERERKKNIELIKTIFCRTKDKRNFIAKTLAVFAKLIVCEYALSLAQILRANKRQLCARIVPTANYYVRHRDSSVYFLCLIFFVSPFAACILHGRMCFCYGISNRIFRQVSFALKMEKIPRILEIDDYKFHFRISSTFHF